MEMESCHPRCVRKCLSHRSHHLLNDVHVDFAMLVTLVLQQEQARCVARHCSAGLTGVKNGRSISALSPT